MERIETFFRGFRGQKSKPLRISAPIQHNSKDRDVDISPLDGRGFQFMSDLHLERSHRDGVYKWMDIPRVAPYLILAGDIGRFCDRDAFASFIRTQCSTFEKVLFVPGNHEFYGSSRSDGLLTAENFKEEFGSKLMVLNRGQAIFEDEKVVVLGCTLHSFIPQDSALTNDFKQIREWHVADHNEEHAADCAWLKEALAGVAAHKPHSRVIIVTHYAPAFGDTTHPMYESSQYRHCFCSDTLLSLDSCPGAEQVTHWIFGHTHYNTRFKSKNVLVVSNQPNDNDCRRKFDVEATI